MTKRIFRSILLVALSATLICCLLTLAILLEFFTTETKNELRNASEYIAKAMDESGNGMDYLTSIRGGDMRITLISDGGEVLFDNTANAAEMENHIDRPEVQQALSGLSGESSRLSDTILRRTHYYARQLSDGTILRLSATQDTVWSMLLRILQPILLILLVAVFLSALLAKRVSRRIIAPLNNLNLDSPLSNDGVYEELSPLLTKIHRQTLEIGQRMEQLQRNRDELNSLTENMAEGLVVFDAKSRILSINASAKYLFDADDAVIGQGVFSLNRNLLLKELIDATIADGQRGEKSLSLHRRDYSAIAAPVTESGKILGCVLFLLDVTERLQSERLRREFSANVSHELKTPLQTISGYAEIMMNGIAEEKDKDHFIERIYTESRRMISLVEDIIKLSALDEGMPAAEMETIELLTLCQGVAKNLEALAAGQKVTLTILGEETEIFGVRPVIEEMVYNLAENAIKYNQAGGNAILTAHKDGGVVTLTVADTGIGIPKEDIPRVFERFYRVDKSRSKETGGTGLGLAIVKHAAQLHGASVDLFSEKGKGTEVVVTFGG